MSYRLGEGYSISSEQFHMGSGYKFFSTKTTKQNPLSRELL